MYVCNIYEYHNFLYIRHNFSHCMLIEKYMDTKELQHLCSYLQASWATCVREESNLSQPKSMFGAWIILGEITVNIGVCCAWGSILHQSTVPYYRCTDATCREVKMKFVASTQYHQLKTEAHYKALGDKMNENTQSMYGLQDTEFSTETGRIVYLSIPPGAYVQTATWVHKHLRPKYGEIWHSDCCCGGGLLLSFSSVFRVLVVGRVAKV